MQNILNEMVKDVLLFILNMRYLGFTHSITWVNLFVLFCFVLSLVVMIMKMMKVLVFSLCPSDLGCTVQYRGTNR